MEDELQGEGLEAGSLVQGLDYNVGVNRGGLEFRWRGQMKAEAKMRTLIEEE